MDIYIVYDILIVCARDLQRLLLGKVGYICADAFGGKGEFTKLLLTHLMNTDKNYRNHSGSMTVLFIPLRYRISFLQEGL